jgi:hypothetical protein
MFEKGFLVWEILFKLSLKFKQYIFLINLYSKLNI